MPISTKRGFRAFPPVRYPDASVPMRRLRPPLLCPQLAEALSEPEGYLTSCYVPSPDGAHRNGLVYWCPSMAHEFRLSVAVPIHNEESVLPELLKRLFSVLNGIQGGPHEIVIV